MDSIHETRHFEKSAGRRANFDAGSESGLYATRVKPAIDFFGALILLLILSPILVISAVAVKLALGSPVMYRQMRIGKDGKPFQLLKLRTMIPDRRQRDEGFEGADRRKTHKSPEDPRVLPPGPLLRALRFDEIPQLWNVVRGDMSLVGPRPELPHIVSDYEEWQHERHEVKPGVTGLWQVSSDGRPMHECTEIDLEYIDAMSFKTDIAILIKTPLAMFRRRGF